MYKKKKQNERVSFLPNAETVKPNFRSVIVIADESAGTRVFIIIFLFPTFSVCVYYYVLLQLVNRTQRGSRARSENLSDYIRRFDDY